MFQENLVVETELELLGLLSNYPIMGFQAGLLSFMILMYIYIFN